MPDTEASLVCQKWNRPFSFRRNRYITQPGQVERYMYYICSGTVKIYQLHQGEEICLSFAYTDSLLCSYPSFVTQKPGSEWIQVLRPVNILAIHRADFMVLIEQLPAFERWYRQLIEQVLLGKIERELELLTLSPEERLKRLLARSPHLFDLIPRKYIASYLRMKPETLSRIKL